MTNKKLALAALVMLALASCKKDSADTGTGTTASASSPSCPYKGKIGFCFTPPAGTTPTEDNEKPQVTFPHAGKPTPAQVLMVRSEEFPLSPEVLKSKRDYAKTAGGGTVIENVDIADGKGFYVSSQRSNNIIVTAIVPSGSKFFECSVNVYNADKEALKNDIQACKSLKLAN